MQLGNCDSMGAVALRIIKEYNRDGRASYKYSLDAMIEKVCFREESVASCTSKCDSFAWAELEIEDGEPYFNLDHGMMPSSVLDANDHRKARINLISHCAEGIYPDLSWLYPLDWWNADTDALFMSGISIGSKVLFQVSFSSYYSNTPAGEYYDEEIEPEILFVQSPEHVWLPVASKLF